MLKLYAVKPKWVGYARASTANYLVAATDEIEAAKRCADILRARPRTIRAKPVVVEYYEVWAMMTPAEFLEDVDYLSYEDKAEDGEDVSRPIDEMLHNKKVVRL